MKTAVAGRVELAARWTAVTGRGELAARRTAVA